MNPNYLMKTFFLYFIKCNWIKNTLSVMIQTKKYSVSFHKPKLIFLIWNFNLDATVVKKDEIIVYLPRFLLIGKNFSKIIDNY